jgi:superfamily II DNA or RNA helicase
VQPRGVDRKALFFAQAVGRFVRARRRGETASVFVVEQIFERIDTLRSWAARPR